MPKGLHGLIFPEAEMQLYARLLTSTAVLTSPRRCPVPSANLFGDLFDDKLKAQTPYERPLLPALVRDAPASYALQEKMFSFSGEDFRVRDIAGNDIIIIDGGNVNLGGWVLDKLAFKDSAGKKFCSVERRAIAASTCYYIYSADGKECVAKVERQWMSMTPKYSFYYEGDANPFADFEAEGSFTDRTYTFKAGGDTIARVRRAPEIVKDVDGYQVEVAAGVDAAAILAVAVIIDEDHDEEDAKREGEEKGGAGMWPFG
jgi:uncharacterized protein YxjI